MFEYIENITIVGVGLIGILVVFLLLFSYKSNKLVNVYLVVIFTFVSFRFIHIGIYELFKHSILESFNYWLSLLSIIAIPNFYLYYKSLLDDSKQYNYKDLLHYIYPSISILLNFIQKEQLFDVNESIDSIQFIMLQLFILFYMILPFQMLNRKLWNAKNLRQVIDRHYLLIKNWTRFFYFTGLLLGFRILVSLYIENNSLQIVSGYSYSIIAVLIWLSIFIKILINPEILYGYPKLEEKLRRTPSTTIINATIWKLSTSEVTNLQDVKLTTTMETKISPYVESIENFINSNHPFRDQNFSIKEFSIFLNIPTSHLAYIFKYNCTMPFVEYKKYCKIEDAKVLISADYLKLNTLETLANEVGFISYNTFYSSFKKYTKLSPKHYVNSISIT